MTKKNGIIEDLGNAINKEIKKMIEPLERFLESIGDEVMSFINYERRICHECGKKVPKNEGMISLSSFIILHDECFEKLRMIK